jgi:hypothetical protein
MADGSNFTFWAWSPPGISVQDSNYNPVTSWWSGVLSQIGFLNIKNMNSDNGDLEMRIASEVGSYGRQRGCLPVGLDSRLGEDHGQGPRRSGSAAWRTV